MEDKDYVDVQVVVGTYDTWWIHLGFNQFEDPVELDELLNRCLPFWERWSGRIRAFGTTQHIDALHKELQRIPNPKFNKPWNYHGEVAPKQFLHCYIDVEVYDRQDKQYYYYIGFDHFKN